MNLNLNMDYLKYFIIYYLVINVIGFISMGWDKFKAKHNMWRTPENTLLLIPLLLGSIGSFIGMKVFRHKTLHPQFKYGIPAFFVINLVCIYFIFKYLIIIT